MYMVEDYGTNMDMGSGIGHDDMSAGFNDGNFVIKSSNCSGGHDTFVNGHHTTHTENNGLGGQNIYHENHLEQITSPNAMGGIDVYNGDMLYEGSFVPNGIGGEDYLSMHGNSLDMMHYQDPLAHASEYRLNPFDVRNNV